MATIRKRITKSGQVQVGTFELGHGGLILRFGGGCGHCFNCRNQTGGACANDQLE